MPGAGWVWRPSRDDWTIHDPNGKYIFIGPGDYTNNMEFIKKVLDIRKPNQINTYALLITPRELLALKGAKGIDETWTVDSNSPNYWRNRLGYWEIFLDNPDILVSLDQVRYASLTEIAQIYEQYEDNIDPNFGQIPRTIFDKWTRTQLFEQGLPFLPVSP